MDGVSEGGLRLESFNSRGDQPTLNEDGELSYYDDDHGVCFDAVDQDDMRTPTPTRGPAGARAHADSVMSDDWIDQYNSSCSRTREDIRTAAITRRKVPVLDPVPITKVGPSY